ncbi:hypothetical protein EAS64_06165 [Trebonia kvetii]|uniref:Uncharacterized protein n=1 Tax=Trebonia kvetii TaxID=2480626 RepID=A0A6P2C985_9ACTN|nr:hypothetical protein EAS64_06165 [Trebonia kvetii]
MSGARWPATSTNGALPSGRSGYGNRTGAAQGSDDSRRSEPHRARHPAHRPNGDPVKTGADHPRPQPGALPAADRVDTVGRDRAGRAARGAGGRGAGHDQSHRGQPR